VLFSFHRLLDPIWPLSGTYFLSYAKLLISKESCHLVKVWYFTVAGHAVMADQYTQLMRSSTVLCHHVVDVDMSFARQIM